MKRIESRKIIFSNSSQVVKDEFIFRDPNNNSAIEMLQYYSVNNLYIYNKYRKYTTVKSFLEDMFTGASMSDYIVSGTYKINNTTYTVSSIDTWIDSQNNNSAIITLIPTSVSINLNIIVGIFDEESGQITLSNAALNMSMASPDIVFHSSVKTGVALVADYASSDYSKGTIDERLTELGF